MTRITHNSLKKEWKNLQIKIKMASKLAQSKFTFAIMKGEDTQASEGRCNYR